MWRLAAATKLSHKRRFLMQRTVETSVSVQHIVAIASGKGGVGKSTTTVNLALAMAARGARVGILDADVYGPSLGLMVGIAEGSRPDVVDEQWFEPLSAYGIQVMSMAFLVDASTPMVWRGPMASSALQQMLNQTRWPSLDYLFVDMPPGTGDIHLTLCQRANISGALIVTTPQDLALLDARKGIEMFSKVHVPILGVVENMAAHICSKCGHEEPVFGAGGGNILAREYQIEMLASIPLSMDIRQQVDGGKPTVVADPKGAVANTYGRLAAAVAKQLESSASSQDLPEISIDDN
jgi:ATP-binding protein involved in chromosome partitioning